MVEGLSLLNLKKPTSFNGLFNSNYGFIQMIFKNIDNSVIKLELINIEEWGKYANKSNSLFKVP